MFSSRTVGGALLVAGTSIGAGMLALPVVTGLGGFVPALAVYVLCWLFMTATGLLLLEICLKLPPDANLISMAGQYLGRGGRAAAWALYLFLFYCLNIAYISGGGGLIASWLGIGSWHGSLLFLAFLAPIVYGGAKIVSRMNGILMVGLIATYLGFVALGLSSVNLGVLAASEWSAALIGLPVIFTSFSYQGIIPSLTAYLHRDAKQVRIAIVAGTTIAFAIYLVWEFLILGIVPVQGEFGLEWARQTGQTAVAPLKYHVASNAVAAIGQGFAFFAIATSFLGVTLGLLDFLADGLRVAKKGWRRVGLALLTFVPPGVFAWVNPHLFISALIFAGGIGCALLLGLLPVLMAWRARYKGACLYREEELLGGGKPMLVILVIFVFVELFFEFKHLII